MSNSQLIESYLGTMCVHEFESASQIDEYFSPTNIIDMFGEYDADEVAAAHSAVMCEWAAL